jgi:hypothetical protein
MRSRRSSVAVFGVVVALVSAASAGAVPSAPARLAYAETAKDAGPARNAGAIDGQVTAVDYHAGKITVKAGNAQYDITVLPSTSIEGHNDTFHTIADIRPGARVRVLMSERDGTYTAQIIHLH